MKMYCSTQKKLWKSSVSSFFFVQTYSAQFYITVVICSNQLSTAVVKSNSLQLLKHIFTTSCSRWKWCIKLLSLCENYVFQLFFLALQYYTPTPIPTPTPAVYLLFTYPVYALNSYHYISIKNITFCSDIITSHFFLEGGGGHYMDGGDIQYHIFLAPDFQTQRLMYTWCELADTKSILVYVLLVTN